MMDQPNTHSTPSRLSEINTLPPEERRAQIRSALRQCASTTSDSHPDAVALFEHAGIRDNEALQSAILDTAEAYVDMAMLLSETEKRPYRQDTKCTITKDNVIKQINAEVILWHEHTKNVLSQFAEAAIEFAAQKDTPTTKARAIGALQKRVIDLAINGYQSITGDKPGFIITRDMGKVAAALCHAEGLFVDQLDPTAVVRGDFKILRDQVASRHSEMVKS